MPDLIAPGGGAATNNAFGVVEMRIPTGFSPPPHIHHNEDQAFYLLSGRIEAPLGDQKIPGEQGSFLRLLRNVLHGFAFSADESTRRMPLHPDLRRAPHPHPTTPTSST